MPCGKKKLVKLWDNPRNIRRIIVSKYEQNEPSVKQHWKNVMKDLEEHYKDDKFWESQSEVVRELVGTKVFKRIQKIFNLPPDKQIYKLPPSPEPSVIPSETFYLDELNSPTTQRSLVGMSDHLSVMSDLHSYNHMEEQEAGEEEASDEKWTITSSTSVSKKSKSAIISKTYLAFSKSSKMKSQKSFSRSQVMTLESEPDEECSSNDDLIVHAERNRLLNKKRRPHNPHYQLLYCNKTETDMIKWKSNYLQKSYDISASDEFSKKAELITKMICNSFFEWWTGMGVHEFKSEIKRPEDIEALFQVWFDEHASRGLVLNPKILPCVLTSIATAVNEPSASCRVVLKKEIASDIYAETTPAHTQAFGKCLPHDIAHVPPRNNTLEMWKSFPVPQDLCTMACIWEDIKHLTSTKAFHAWLQENPHLPMPRCFGAEEVDKVPFTQPSDYYLTGERTHSLQELALPVSQISIELKTVLSQLMA